MQLNHIVDRIDSAFGEEMPFSDRELAAEDLEVLTRIFGDRGYQRYLQDQVNRQIIRDYLTNAVVLGHLVERDLEALACQLGTRQGRATLSLHMLMSSVEQAAELSGVASEEALKALEPEHDSPPHIRLVHS